MKSMSSNSIEHCDIKKNYFESFINYFKSNDNNNDKNKRILIIGSKDGEWVKSPEVVFWLNSHIKENKEFSIRDFITLHRVVIGYSSCLL